MFDEFNEVLAPEYPEQMSHSLETFDETEQYQNDNVMSAALEPEIRTDIPNCETAIVYGEPYKRSELVDSMQGDNPYNARGNCGLVSIANILRISGKEVSETDVTGYAIEKGYCQYDRFGDECDNGGTTFEGRQKIFADYGIQTEICMESQGYSIENIADAVENGKGVIVGVNADILWNKDLGSPTFAGMPVANHIVTVTGVARDASTGEVAGLYICDSGHNDACRYLTADEFNAAYRNVYNAGANITTNSI